MGRTKCQPAAAGCSSPAIFPHPTSARAGRAGAGRGGPGGAGRGGRNIHHSSAATLPLLQLDTAVCLNPETTSLFPDTGSRDQTIQIRRNGQS